MITLRTANSSIPLNPPNQRVGVRSREVIATKITNGWGNDLRFKHGMLERRACCYGTLTKVCLGGSFACLVWAKSESQVWAWDLNPPTQLNAIDSSTGERADKRRIQSFMGYKKQIVVYLLQVVTCFHPPNWQFPLTDSHKTFHFSYMKFLYLLKNTTHKGRPGYEEDLTQKYC